MNANEKKNFIYRFGKFTLDPQEKTLCSDGTPLHLPAKEFETLLLLVENNGRALSKEEIMSVVWQDSFVEESNLAKQVSRLRKIFDGDGEIRIETLSKHGYRFSAQISRIFPTEAETILEKHTVKKLSVTVDDEIEDIPPMLPPKRQRRWLPVALAALILPGVSIVGWIWLPRGTKPVNPTESGVSVLTDGQFGDREAYWTNEGRIFFTRFLSKTRAESWTMNADGTNQFRANTDIKNLRHGRFSPDGKKVVFRKEGDDQTVYLADANGTNEIVLPFTSGNMDWSPDSSQFVYQAGSNGDKSSEIFLYTPEMKQSVNLTNNNIFDGDPNFSPDGTKIAFVSSRDGNMEVYVMNTDGSNIRRLTNHPAFDNFPVFSPDGTQIAFQSNRENERQHIFLLNLENDLPPMRITNFRGWTGLHPKCWSADGTQMLVHNDQNGKDRIMLINVEPYQSKTVLSDESADLNFPRLSPDGGQFLYQARFNEHTIELRVTDLAAKKTKTIYKTEGDYPPGYQISPSWSPDGQRVAFSAKTGGNTDVFVINADGSGLQKLTDDPALNGGAVFSPDGKEIVFVRDSFGKAHLYRMNSDGSNQRRLTDKEAIEANGAFSPDGSSFVFSVGKEGRGMDIYLLDFQNPNNEKLLAARRFHELLPVFSPDGKRIAFISSGDGNSEIYLMNSDGTGLFRLTRTKTDEYAPEFSKDGNRLIFASNRSGKYALYEIELP